MPCLIDAPISARASTWSAHVFTKSKSEPDFVMTQMCLSIPRALLSVLWLGVVRTVETHSGCATPKAVPLCSTISVGPDTSLTFGAEEQFFHITS